jgi:DNA-binding beta-propeller fold protein YncE
MARALTTLPNVFLAGRTVRRASVCAVLTIVWNLAAAQTLSYRMGVPDSLGVAGYPSHGVYSPAVNKLYLAGRGAVSVFGGGPAGGRIGRIGLTGVAFEPSAGLHYDSALGKLYVVDAYDTLIQVIDVAADSVVARFALPQWEYAFDGVRCAALDPLTHKLYVMTASTCFVYDCIHDTLLHAMATTPGDICISRKSRKVYIQTRGFNQVQVFDAVSDTLRATVATGNGTSDIIFLERFNKLYVCNYFGASLSIIDGSGDTLIRELPTPVGPMFPSVNERDGTVCVTTDVGFVIIDGHGDSILNVVPALDPRAGSTWNSTNDQFYCAYRGGAKVVDGATGALTKDIPYPMWPGGAICDYRRNVVYLTATFTYELLAIDGSSDTVLWHEYNGLLPWYNAVRWSRVNRKLYGLGYNGFGVMSEPISPNAVASTSLLPCSTDIFPSGLTFDQSESRLFALEAYWPKVMVVSCSTLAVIDSVPLPGFPTSEALMVPQTQRMYVATTRPHSNGSYVCVVDPSGDSLLETIPCTYTADGLAGVYCPPQEKVYWPLSAESLLVFDARNDSFIRSIRVTVDQGSHIKGLVWHPEYNRLYLSTEEAGRIKVLDCATDSIIATVYSLPPLAYMVYCSASNKVFGVADNTGEVVAVDCNTNRLVAHIVLNGGMNVRPVYNPATNHLFVASNAHGNGILLPVWWIVAINCATNQPDAWIQVDYEPWAMDLDPDSNRVLVHCTNSSVYVIQDQATGVTEAPQPANRRRASLDVRPNPTTGGISVSAYVPTLAQARLTVYDATGRQVSTLADTEMGPGVVQAWWDGTDGSQRQPAGTYIVRLDAGATHLSRKVVLTGR